MGEATAAADSAVAALGTLPSSCWAAAAGCTALLVTAAPEPPSSPTSAGAWSAATGAAAAAPAAPLSTASCSPTTACPLSSPPAAAHSAATVAAAADACALALASPAAPGAARACAAHSAAAASATSACTSHRLTVWSSAPDSRVLGPSQHSARTTPLWPLSRCTSTSSPSHSATRWTVLSASATASRLPLLLPLVPLVPGGLGAQASAVGWAGSTRLAYAARGRRWLTRTQRASSAQARLSAPGQRRTWATAAAPPPPALGMCDQCSSQSPGSHRQQNSCTEPPVCPTASSWGPAVVGGSAAAPAASNAEIWPAFSPCAPAAAARVAPRSAGCIWLCCWRAAGLAATPGLPALAAGNRSPTSGHGPHCSRAPSADRLQSAGAVAPPAAPAPQRRSSTEPCTDRGRSRSSSSNSSHCLVMDWPQRPQLLTQRPLPLHSFGFISQARLRGKAHCELPAADPPCA